MKKSLKILSLVLSFSLLFIACTKDDPAGMDEMRDKAKLVFINATVNNSTVPGEALREVGIYPVYNGLNFNNHPIQYPWTNGYKAFDPGTLNLKLDTCFSPGTNPPSLDRATVKDLSLQVEADSYYSLFSVGTIYAVDTFFIRDDLSFPSSGKAKILFLNLSIDAGPIDIVNAVTGEVVAANISYKDRRGYVEVNPGNYRYQINAAGTSTVLRAARDLIIDANSVYTVWARGLRTIPAPGSTLANHQLQLSYHANRWTY
ncbi:DUF4397 domain-containing protein [Flavihumibacter sp. RY-1]|uniref:DUF4397 domain-containing protein n=1 Tax=Flavihumibacter fluminis TaxID=2909236 RepID=A0ABS9BDD5_9BACT|nr:DUF4397 domain-containing protein [Flavihumibacter fluminis]MCF1713712.1 DUF4397 domain-containing protein [Flavihumibacter fluminis]